MSYEEEGSQEDIDLDPEALLAKRPDSPYTIFLISYAEDGSQEDIDLDPEALLAEPPESVSSSLRLVISALVHVDLPSEEIQILLQAGGKDSTGEDGCIPIGSPLRLSLPTSYPSNSAPTILAVNSMWATPRQAGLLKSALMSQWDEQTGGQEGFPIIFVWMDYLKSGALPDLGIRSTLSVESPQTSEQLAQGDEETRASSPGAPPPPPPPAPSEASHSGSNASGSKASRSGSEAPCSKASGSKASRPCSGSNAGAASQSVEDESAMQGAQAVAMAILNYSARKEFDVFQTEIWTCKICFDDVPGSRCVRLPDCTHHFCTDCFSTHCRMNVNDGTVDKVTCPEPGCKLAVPPFVLQSILTPEEFQRWESLLLQKTLDRMDDVAAPSASTSSAAAANVHGILQSPVLMPMRRWS
eukprot:gene6631-3289_t